jgi:hypothetical protein
MMASHGNRANTCVISRHVSDDIAATSDLATLGESQASCDPGRRVGDRQWGLPLIFLRKEIQRGPRHRKGRESPPRA